MRDRSRHQEGYPQIVFKDLGSNISKVSKYKGLILFRVSTSLKYQGSICLKTHFKVQIKALWKMYRVLTSIMVQFCLEY